MGTISTSPAGDTRPLRADDLEHVILIDHAHVRQSRRRFFEKRFESARSRPADFIHLGIVQHGSLAGFVLAHISHGEFGRHDAIATLDAVGVKPESREQGLGKLLIDSLVEALRRSGVASLESQADWRSHELLRFFELSGLMLAPRLCLERSVTTPLPEPVDES